MYCLKTLIPTKVRVERGINGIDNSQDNAPLMIPLVELSQATDDYLQSTNHLSKLSMATAVRWMHAIGFRQVHKIGSSVTFWRKQEGVNTCPSSCLCKASLYVALSQSIRDLIIAFLRISTRARFCSLERHKYRLLTFLFGARLWNVTHCYWL